MSLSTKRFAGQRGKAEMVPRGKQSSQHLHPRWSGWNRPCPCHLLSSGLCWHLPAIKTSPCHQILLSRAVPGGCAAGKAMAGQGKGAKEAGRKKEQHPLPIANHPPLSPKRGHQVCKYQVEFLPWRGSTEVSGSSGYRRELWGWA